MVKKDSVGLLEIFKVSMASGAGTFTGIMGTMALAAIWAAILLSIGFFVLHKSKTFTNPDYKMAGKVFGFMLLILGLLPFLGFIGQGMAQYIGFFVGDVIMKQVQEL